MSDFTQEFTRKVQNSVDARGSSNRVKRKIDKRWFILAGLVVVFVTMLVILLIRNSEDGETGSEGIVGSWLCDDGVERGFTGDGEYSWFGNGEAESGTYNVTGNELELNRTSYFNGSFDVNVLLTVYDLEYSENNELYIRGDEKAYHCSKVDV